MAEKNKTVKPVEVLTDDKMRDLFGTNYSNIIYYNYDKGAWNRNEYLGYDLTVANHMTSQYWAPAVKGIIDREYANIELVACVVMMIEARDYKRGGAIVKAPHFDPLGTAFVGNVVYRNRRSHKIAPIGSDWICAGHFVYPDRAAMSVGEFLHQLAFNAKFRHTLMDAKVRRK